MGRHPCPRVHRARRLPHRDAGSGKKAQRAMQNPGLGARRKRPGGWGWGQRRRRIPRGARPVHLLITMVKWIRTSRMSAEAAVSGGPLAWSSCCMRAPVHALDGLAPGGRWPPAGRVCSKPHLVPLARAYTVFRMQQLAERQSRGRSHAAAVYALNLIRSRWAPSFPGDSSRAGRRRRWRGQVPRSLRERALCGRLSAFSSPTRRTVDKSRDPLSRLLTPEPAFRSWGALYKSLQSSNYHNIEQIIP